MDDAGRGTAWISINIDREEGRIDNHRCPDGAVILTGNTGRWVGGNQAAFLGGPDLVLEVLSEEDETYLKLPFYRDRGVRIVDPDAGRAELWRLSGREYARVPEPLRARSRASCTYRARRPWRCATPRRAAPGGCRPSRIEWRGGKRAEMPV